MIPCPEGVIVYGGYKKEYKGGKNFVGIALEDMWTLKYVVFSKSCPTHIDV